MRKSKYIIIIALVLLGAVCLVACDDGAVDPLEGFGAGNYYDASAIVYEMTMYEGDTLLSSINTQYTRTDSGMNVHTVQRSLNPSAEGETYLDKTSDETLDLVDLKDKLPRVRGISKDNCLNGQYEFTTQEQITTIIFTPASVKEFFGLSDAEAERVSNVEVKVVYQVKNPTSYIVKYMLGGNSVEMKITYTY